MNQYLNAFWLGTVNCKHCFWSVQNLSDDAKVTVDKHFYLGVFEKDKNFGIFLSYVTNCKNSLELIAFCGGVVSTQDVFLCEFELWGSKS